MKSIPLELNFFGQQLKVVSNETSTEHQHKSPYLKAILSGATRTSNAANDLFLTNPDRAAAIRYIRESAIPRK